MPRYSAPTSYGFQPLTSAHRQTMFLRNVSDNQLQGLQQYARDNHSTTLHPEARADFAKATRNQLVYALWKEEGSRVKKEKVGGGLGDVLNWVGKKVSQPIRGAWNYAKNLTHGFLHPTQPGRHPACGHGNQRNVQKGPRQAAGPNRELQSRGRHGVGLARHLEERCHKPVASDLQGLT